MKDLFLLLIITIVLCFLTKGSQNLTELAALVILGLGTKWIFSEATKPISH